MIKKIVKDWSGKVFVDGLDIFTEFGVFILDGEYKSLIQMPSFKKLSSTEWSEHDGIEVDLLSPQLSHRTLSIEFGLNNVRNIEDFICHLSDGAYHEFDFRELGRKFTLRLTQGNSVTSLYRLGKTKLTFSYDYPDEVLSLAGKTETSEVTQRGYAIDGIDLSEYGVWVLQGSDDSIRKTAQVRPALTTDVTTRSGVIYDAESVHFKAKDVTLKCLINAPSVGEFWKRWANLWRVLTSSGEHRFFFAALDKDFSCYYKSNAVSKFKVLRNGHVWCEFNIVLCFTGDGLRPLHQYRLLLTEDDDETFVVLEDGGTTISLRPNIL